MKWNKTISTNTGKNHKFNWKLALIIPYFVPFIVKLLGPAFGLISVAILMILISKFGDKKIF